MPTYKTPDVYIEELSVFPPSVAEVETAIPAFVGYTEKATKIATNDLLNVPTRVQSLLEFQTYFGGAPAIALAEVKIGDSNEFLSATFTNNYYLYDSLRSFFDNGGGPCYIVSVGSYVSTVDRDVLKTGLDAVRKYDEPTILVFPDAASLAADKLGAVQQHALTQCAELKDRVAVLDTRSDDQYGTTFRSNIGINNLKYGATYSPWLKVSYSKNLSYKNVKSVITKGGVATTLNTLTTDAGILATITNLDNALSDQTLIANSLTTLLAGSPSVTSKFSTLYTAYVNASTDATKRSTIQSVYGFLFGIARTVDALVDNTTGVKNAAFKSLIQNSVTNTLKTSYLELIANEKELDAEVDPSYTVQWNTAPLPDDSSWGSIFGGSAPAASSVISGADDTARTLAAMQYILKNFPIINGQIDSYIAAAASYVQTYEQTLYDIYPVYKNIVSGINDTVSAVPPSGTIAGVYSMVDNQRGVWKAPANVSLSNVVAPTYSFTSSETDALNVDANAGKSINAIRSFAGKGTLVWGARTLAGNDNEWRYVSVRRFFNMVEESVKKSTYWAVFEPNDANTWVKVRGMIENYLTQKWREGALAGATTKDAFFVRCGLGVTMTSQDILEGRMNVEIGMAVVRPAEFIILKFSHLLQTS